MEEITSHTIPEDPYALTKCSSCRRPLHRTDSKKIGTCCACRGESFTDNNKNYRFGDDFREDEYNLKRNNPRY